MKVTTALAAIAASGSFAFVHAQDQQGQQQQQTPAPSSSATAPASTTTPSNPLIPSGISSTCSTFLTALNNDPTVSACSSPLLSATEAFSSSTSTSGNAVTSSTLQTLCSATSSTCDPTSVQTSLSYFAGNCSDELQAGNQVVVSNYDVLYVLLPLHQAVCAQDPSTGDYCALKIANGTTGAGKAGSKTTSQQQEAPVSSVAPGALNASVPLPSGTVAGQVSANGTNVTAGTGFVQFAVQTATDAFAFDLKDLYYTVSTTATSLFKRQQAQGQDQGQGQAQAQNATVAANKTITTANAALPNATTFRNSYLPFLFLNPNQSSSELCTACTKSVLATYVKWETSSTYALGLSHSPLLGNQAKLWSALGTACGSGFLSSVQQQAGTDGLNLGGGAAKIDFGLVAAIGAGLVAVVGYLM